MAHDPLHRPGPTLYPAECSFPRCRKPASASARPDRRLPLCFDHQELLFYRPDEFSEAWVSREGRPAVGR